MLGFHWMANPDGFPCIARFGYGLYYIIRF